MHAGMRGGRSADARGLPPRPRRGGRRRRQLRFTAARTAATTKVDARELRHRAVRRFAEVYAAAGEDDTSTVAAAVSMVATWWQWVLQSMIYLDEGTEMKVVELQAFCSIASWEDYRELEACWYSLCYLGTPPGSTDGCEGHGLDHGDFKVPPLT